MITKEDIDLIDSEWFEDEESFVAFKQAAQLGMQLEGLKNQGYIILHDDELDRSCEFRIDFDGMNSTVMNTCITVAGCTHDEEGRIYKKLNEVEKYFSRFSCVRPEHVVKL